MTEDTRIVSSFSARYLATWTPDHFDAAVLQSDGGDLAAAADFSLAIMHDDRVRGCFSTRTLGLLGLPLTWSTDPARASLSPPSEPSGWYALAPEAELNRLLAWGLMLGVGFAYVQPWGALKTWHPRWMRWDENRRCWFAQTREGEVPVIPGRGWIVYTPYGESEPWQYGLWLTLAVPFLAKRFAVHDRARASEVFGSAMVVGDAPEGATEKQRTKFLSDLNGLARAARIVLPPGFKVDLVEAQGQTWGIYDQAISWADDAITIAITGQLVTTEGTKGWNRGDVHEKIALSLTRFGAETFSTCLGRQFLPQVWGKLQYPHWDVDPPGDRLTSVASSLSTFGAAVTVANEALKPYGKRVDVMAYVADFDEIKVVPIFAEQRDDSDGTAAAPLPAPALVAPQATTPPRDYAKELAERMTELKQPTCEHGSSNRCRLCKVERDRALELDPVTGETVWAIKWRPYEAAAPALPPAAIALAQSVAGTRPWVQADRKAHRGAAQSDLGPEPPTEFRIFAAGPNPVDSGDALVWFTPRSAELIMAQRESRDLMIDLEHRSLSGIDPDARGWGQSLELRNGELWATNVKWLPDGDRRIRTKLQRSISPYFTADPRTGEIIELVNCALTALPAMPFAPVLIAAARREKPMDPKLLEMLGLPPEATIEQVLEAIAAMKMVAAKAGEAAPPQAAPPSPQHPPQAAPAPVYAPPAPQSTVADQMVQSLAKEIAALRASQENGERNALLANAALSPLERDWLATQSLDAARTYVQNVASKRTAAVPPAGAPGPDASVDAVAKATGMSRDYVRESLKGGA